MQSSGRGVCAAQRYPGYVGAHIPWGHLEIDQHFWSWHLSLSLLQGRRSSVCFTKIISAAMSFLFCVCTAASDRGLTSPHHCSQWEAWSIWLLKNLYPLQVERKKNPSKDLSTCQELCYSLFLLPFESTNIISAHFQPMIFRDDG